jgi:hypothetical protein
VRPLLLALVALAACKFEIAAGGSSDDADVIDPDAARDAAIDAAIIDAPPPDAPGPPIQLLQKASAFLNNVTSVSCNFAMAQTAGHTNIVVVSWSSGTSDVATVVDTAGNTYVKAPLTIGNMYSIRIYYASNIQASSANRVTATFAQNMPFPKLRIFEYSGLATSDAYESGSSLSGTSMGAAAGPVMTTTPHTLLFAPNVINGVSGAVLPFVAVDTSDGDLVEHREVTTPGTYSAAATINASVSWVMMLAVFRGR